MKWKAKEVPRVGHKKTVTKFLLFPKKAGGEYRWLETVTMNMKFVFDYETSFARWEAIEFVDEN